MVSAFFDRHLARLVLANQDILVLASDWLRNAHVTLINSMDISLGKFAEIRKDEVGALSTWFSCPGMRVSQGFCLLSRTRVKKRNFRGES